MPRGVCLTVELVRLGDVLGLPDPLPFLLELPSLRNEEGVVEPDGTLNIREFFNGACDPRLTLWVPFEPREGDEVDEVEGTRNLCGLLLAKGLDSGEAEGTLKTAMAEFGIACVVTCDGNHNERYAEHGRQTTKESIEHLAHLPLPAYQRRGAYNIAVLFALLRGLLFTVVCWRNMALRVASFILTYHS